MPVAVEHGREGVQVLRGRDRGLLGVGPLVFECLAAGTPAYVTVGDDWVPPAADSPHKLRVKRAAVPNDATPNWAESPPAETELVVATCDLDMIEEVRKTWQFYRDRRPEAYGDLTKP